MRPPEANSHAALLGIQGRVDCLFGAADGRTRDAPVIASIVAIIAAIMVAIIIARIIAIIAMIAIIIAISY